METKNSIHELIYTFTYSYYNDRTLRCAQEEINLHNSLVEHSVCVCLYVYTFIDFSTSPPQSACNGTRNRFHVGFRLYFTTCTVPHIQKEHLVSLIHTSLSLQFWFVLEIVILNFRGYSNSWELSAAFYYYLLLLLLH